MDVMTFVRTQWDRVSAALCSAVGAVVLILGWFRISGTAFPAEQVPYLVSAGLGSIFLLGVAAVLWLSADLRDEWRKLDRIEQAIRQSGLQVGSEPPAQPEPPAPRPSPVPQTSPDPAGSTPDADIALQDTLEVPVGGIR